MDETLRVECVRGRRHVFDPEGLTRLLEVEPVGDSSALQVRRPGREPPLPCIRNRPLHQRRRTRRATVRHELGGDYVAGGIDAGLNHYRTFLLRLIPNGRAGQHPPAA